MERQPETDILSPRRELMESLRTICKSVNGGRYWVHRGPLNWTAHDWEKHPNAIAIMADEGSLFRDAKGISTAAITLEIFVHNEDRPTEISDGLYDVLYDDAQRIFLTLFQQVNESGDALVIRHERNDNAIQTFDAEYGVQGLVVTVRVDY